MCSRQRAIAEAIVATSTGQSITDNNVLLASKLDATADLPSENKVHAALRQE
jgi:hypothetical protein